MAYITGTATDYLDLLDTLRVFVTTGLGAENWTQKRWEVGLPSPNGAGYNALQLMGPGLDGTDEIYVGIRSYAEAADSYCWQLAGATGYYASKTFVEQPNGSAVGNNQGQVVYLWNDLMDYWIVANGRRIIMVASVGGTYHAMYLGLLEQMYDEKIYGYPLAVGGSGRYQDGRYSGDNKDYCCFMSPTSESSGYISSSLRVRDPSGKWGFADNYSLSAHRPLEVFPVMSEPIDTSNYIESKGKPTHDGYYVIKPFLVLGYDGYSDWRVNYTAPLGYFDGVGWISGYNNQAENTLVIDGDTWVAFPNVFRNGWNDFFAVRLT